MDVLFSASAIEERVLDMADDLNRDFKNEQLVHVVVTLNGAFMFAADLVRHFNFPVALHFTGGSFFEGHVKKEVMINPETLPNSFGNAPVLVIEDVMDSGKTVAQLRQILVDKKAGSIKVASLLKRQGGAAKVDYYGFTVPSQLFVVGYGMDLDGRYRELKDIHNFGDVTMGAAEGVC